MDNSKRQRLRTFFGRNGGKKEGKGKGRSSEVEASDGIEGLAISEPVASIGSSQVRTIQTCAKFLGISKRVRSGI